MNASEHLASAQRASRDQLVIEVRGNMSRNLAGNSTPRRHEPPMLALNSSDPVNLRHGTER